MVLGVCRGVCVVLGYVGLLVFFVVLGYLGLLVFFAVLGYIGMLVFVWRWGMQECWCFFIVWVCKGACVFVVLVYDGVLVFFVVLRYVEGGWGTVFLYLGFIGHYCLLNVFVLLFVGGLGFQSIVCEMFGF